MTAKRCLGLDTSNYTTSTALFDGVDGYQLGRLLDVESGSLGLRQSDALFQHVKRLPELFDRLRAEGRLEEIAAVGASIKPRWVEGSYMPCFLAGETAGRILADTLGVPFFPCAHQQGHIAAVAWGAGRLELLDKPLLAWHLSGGTTDCLWVRPDRETVFSIVTLASSLDLKAGQAVDRVGGLLGLSFPAGPALDRLAAQSEAKCRWKPVFKGDDCCLSGIQNICEKLVREGTPPNDVARICIEFIYKALSQMTQNALRDHPGLPLIYCGGVMSNSIISQRMAREYGGHFAQPSFSSDNASGPAILAWVKEENR